MDQKSSFFICPRVSARFLHCFCTVSRDAMGTLTCKIRQRAQKLHSEKLRCFAQKQRKLETFKIRVSYPVGSFNQRARDSSSLERTKRTMNRCKKRFVVFFVLCGLLELVSTTFFKNFRGQRYRKNEEDKHVQLLPMLEARASCLKKYISLWRQDAGETKDII